MHKNQGFFGRQLTPVWVYKTGVNPWILFISFLLPEYSNTHTMMNAYGKSCMGQNPSILTSSLLSFFFFLQIFLWTTYQSFQITDRFSGRDN